MAYNSIYGAGKIEGRQLIMEIFCYKIAKYKKVTLPDLFWRDTRYRDYSKFFKIHAPKVSQLLNSFSADLIIKALWDKRAEYICSPTNKNLIPLLKEIEIEEKHKKKTELKTIDPNNKTSIPKKKSKYDWLK
jgi:hypothetical protein